MALFVTAGDDVGDFNTPDFGVLLGSKATRDWLAGLTRELQEISDGKTGYSGLDLRILWSYTDIQP